MNDKSDTRHLFVSSNADKPQTSQFINYVRFVVFEGDLTEVYLSKNFAIQNDWHKRKQMDAKRGIKEEYYQNFQDVFNGCQFMFQEIDTEIKTWKRIKQMTEAKLDDFDATLEQDLEMLKGDDLTRNQRNCIQVRKEYKEILHWLIETADKLVELMNMPYKDAKIDVNTKIHTKY